MSSDIAFCAWPADNLELEDIFRLDPGTGAVTQVTHDNPPNTVSDRGGSWSPDRRRLAVYRSGGGMPDGIAVIDAETGATEVRITTGLFPVWLDDGTLLYIGSVTSYAEAATRSAREVFAYDPVSYTHLTLPTKRIV